MIQSTPRQALRPTFAGCGRSPRPPTFRGGRRSPGAADKLRREGKDDKAIATYRTVKTGMEINMPKVSRSYFGQGLICAKTPEQRKKATEFLRHAVYYITDNSDLH